MGHQHTHFKGREAIEHVAEAQAEGIVSSVEIHGAELPGHLFAATDSARETSLLLLLMWLILNRLGINLEQTVAYLSVFALSWLIWKAGRSAWLGWFRLERLHRVIQQEKWEIEHNRGQEREELKALYAAKGFEGKLLEEVLDVLMADGDRLLKVMIEEELGLSLEMQEHPLKQGAGALIGVFVAFMICLLSLLIYPTIGLIVGTLLVVTLASFIAAKQTQNRPIPAILWNIGLAVLSFGSLYSLLDSLVQKN
jgi:vacuolar iron transporter family protein